MTNKMEDIRKMDLLVCNKQELRMRCAFDERYIRELEKKIMKLQAQIDSDRALYEATRDYDGEFD